MGNAGRSRRRLAPLYTTRFTTFVAALFAAVTFAATGAHARQDEPPRRPQGPAASPIIKLPRGTGVEADATEQSRPERSHEALRKWEYCAIVGFVQKERSSSSLSLSTPRTPWAVIRYFPKGYEEIEGVNEEDALANAFVKLGEDGWEMTGLRTSLHLSDGDGQTRHVYYFKRPKRDD